jgi:CheY-like chemotaxis protein
MGGRVWGVGSLGEGSTFNFTIRVKKSTQPVSEGLFIPNMAGIAGKRVLVVDDNNTNLIILKGQLKQWDLVPVTCSSAKQALKFLEQDNDFSLIITDMEMPEMDGAGFARVIKNMPNPIPTILLSSFGDASRKEFPGLFASILIKPVKQSQLWKSICAILGDQTDNAQSEKHQTTLLDPEFALLHPLNILVAEDNLFNQKVIERILNKLGYKIDIACNGRIALEMTNDKHYDLILMDIQMPEMDGFEATRKIRELQTQQPYIVAMTANALAEDRDICLSKGMDNYVSKPVKLEILVSLLREVPALKVADDIHDK